MLQNSYIFFRMVDNGTNKNSYHVLHYYVTRNLINPQSVIRSYPDRVGCCVAFFQKHLINYSFFFFSSFYRDYFPRSPTNYEDNRLTLRFVGSITWVADPDNCNDPPSILERNTFPPSSRGFDHCSQLCD